LKNIISFVNKLDENLELIVYEEIMKIMEITTEKVKKAKYLLFLERTFINYIRFIVLYISLRISNEKRIIIKIKSITKN
jgi:hypothetical protein